MTAWAASLTVGRVQAGEREVVFIPRVASLAGRRGVVLCRGAGGPSAPAFIDSTTPGTWKWVNSFVSAGRVVVGADLGTTDNWGNDLVVSRVEACRTLLGTLGCANDKIILAAGSMGSMSALNYTRANPTRVAAYFGIIPACDLQDMRSRTVNAGPTFGAAIETAWGIGSGAALPARANPSDSANAALIASSGATFRFYYSTADNTIIPSTVTALAAQLGVTPTIISTTLDHSDAAVGAFPPADVASVLAAAA